MSRSLLAYALRRLVAGALVLLVVSIVMFSLVHLAPGGPEQTLGGRFATPESLRAIRAQYGLDRPLPVQYAQFLGHVLHLDFGQSIARRTPVASTLLNGLRVTVPLVLASFTLVVTAGTALGALAAYRRGSIVDRLIIGGALAGASAPVFATSVLLLYVFGARLGWLPTFGTGEGIDDRVRHLVLPVVALTTAGVASVMRLSRTAIAHALDQDFVTFARARGLHRRYVLRRLVLRNAGVQVLTASGAVLLALASGAILIEVTFGLDGVGATFVDAIAARDLPVVQAGSLLIALFIVVVNLTVDLLYVLLDPRVALARRATT